MIRNLISLTLIVGAGALFFLYTKPAYDNLGVAQAHINDYDQALVKAKELQTLKQTLLSRYNTFNPTDLDRLQKLLPDHIDNVRLVLDLDTLASRHGLALQNVVVSAPETTISSNVQTIGGKAYDSVTLRFATAGTYENFVAFMTDLETSLRIVDVVSLKMQGDQATTGVPTYRFDIQLRTYWLE